jgi:hypothetical protein
MIKIPDPGNDKDEKFLSRWSRRKHSTRIENTTAVADPQVPEEAIPLNTIIPSESTGRMLTAVEADQQPENAAEENQEPGILTDEDMSAVEELGEDSDYSGFLSSGVSDKLRKIALRKLFAGAGFNIRDGLDDYDEDFTNFPALGDIVTCDMKHQMELTEERKRQAEELAEKERLALLDEGEDVPAQESQTLDDDAEKDESKEESKSEVVAENARFEDSAVDRRTIQSGQSLKQTKADTALDRETDQPGEAATTDDKSDNKQPV